MKRKEQLFGVLLSLMLMLVLMAGMSAAAHAETTYPVWVGGVQVTSANMGNVLAGDPVNDGRVSCTPTEGTTPATLTLNGASITDGHTFITSDFNHTAAIYAEGDLTIYVAANGTVTGPESDFSYDIFTNGSLTVTGPGTLTATGGAATNGGNSCGIFTIEEVTVEESGTLTAAGNTQAISGSVRNAVTGTGRTNVGGTQGGATIAVSAERGQDLYQYRKVQFLAAAPSYHRPDFLLPKSIRTIGANAFEGGAMKVVYISDNCTAIGAGAFKNCANLTQIRLPRDCAINDTAFDGCGTVCVFAAVGGTTESWCQGKDNIIFVRLEY